MTRTNVVYVRGALFFCAVSLISAALFVMLDDGAAPKKLVAAITAFFLAIPVVTGVYDARCAEDERFGGVASLPKWLAALESVLGIYLLLVVLGMAWVDWLPPRFALAVFALGLAATPVVVAVDDASHGGGGERSRRRPSAPPRRSTAQLFAQIVGTSTAGAVGFWTLRYLFVGGVPGLLSDSWGASPAMIFGLLVAMQGASFALSLALFIFYLLARALAARIVAPPRGGG